MSPAVQSTSVVSRLTSSDTRMPVAYSSSTSAMSRVRAARWVLVSFASSAGGSKGCVSTSSVWDCCKTVGRRVAFLGVDSRLAGLVAVMPARVVNVKNDRIPAMRRARVPDEAP